MPLPKHPSAAASARATSDTIQCFKPGRHLALSGATLEFAQSDLAATAAAYDPALHEAPLVVGHPALDAPAYGWVQALAFAAGALEAAPRQVNAEFAELVNTGAFKKVSAAFWTPDAPGNPVPGVYYLRHIGFLGAAAPAVQGLRTPKFAADEAGVVEFSAAFSSAWDDVDNASLWRGLRDWVLGKFGLDEADRAVPAYLVTSVERAAQAELNAPDESAQVDQTDQADPASPPAAAAFAAPHAADATRSIPASSTHAPEGRTVTEQEAIALKDENTRLHGQLAAQASAQRERRTAAAMDEAAAFADRLVGAGRLAAGERDAVVELIARLARGEGEDGTRIEFGAGEAKTALLPEVKKLLEQLPVRAAIGRVADGRRAAGEGGATAAFAAPAGYSADPAKVALHERVLAYAGAHPEADYAQALAACLAGRG